MSRLFSVILFLLVVLLHVAPGTAQSSSRSGQAADNWDEYGVVYERSVFSRDRTRRPPKAQPVEDVPVVDEQPAEDVEPEEPPTPPHPATHFLLIGVSQVDDAGTAIFEDRRDGTIHHVQAGDELGELRIDAVGELAITTVYEGRPVKVQLGRTLTGETPAPVAAPVGGGASGDSSGGDAADAGANGSTSQGTAGSSEAADPNTLSIIERMRLRRQQELGQ